MPPSLSRIIAGAKSKYGTTRPVNEGPRAEPFVHAADLSSKPRHASFLLDLRLFSRLSNLDRLGIREYLCAKVLSDNGSDSKRYTFKVKRRYSFLLLALGLVLGPAYLFLRPKFSERVRGSWSSLNHAAASQPDYACFRLLEARIRMFPETLDVMTGGWWLGDLLGVEQVVQV